MRDGFLLTKRKINYTAIKIKKIVPTFVIIFVSTVTWNKKIKKKKTIRIL